MAPSALPTPLLASHDRAPDPVAVLSAFTRLAKRLDDEPAGRADLAILSGAYASAAAALGERDHVTLLPNRRRFKADHDAAPAPAGSTLMLVTLADARYFNEILRALGHSFAEAFVRKGA